MRRRIYTASALLAVVGGAIGIACLSSGRGTGSRDAMESAQAETVQLGDIGPMKAGYYKRQFLHKFRNVLDRPLDLSLVRVATPCCTPAMVSGKGILHPGDAGALTVDVKCSAVRVGPVAIRIPLNDSSTPPRRIGELLVNYTISPGTISGWDSAALDFGSVCKRTEPFTRELTFSIQPVVGVPPPLDVSLSRDCAAITFAVSNPEIVKGMGGQSAALYKVSARINPAELPATIKDLDLVAFAQERHRARIWWKMVDEYERAPAGEILFMRDAGAGQSTSVTFWNHVAEDFDVAAIEVVGSGVSCERKTTRSARVQHIAVRAGPQLRGNEARYVEVRLLARNGEEHVDRIAIRPLDPAK